MNNLLNFNNSIKEELKEHIHGYLTDLEKQGEKPRNLEDLHFECFNSDYYIIGYFNAEQWLKKHNISTFEGISFVQDYERDNFGDEGVRNYDNAETLVNMITYILGEEIIYNLDSVSSWSVYNHKL